MAAIGIDLGTTYSCVAVYVNKRVEVIANDEGARTTPSVVAFSNGLKLVGAAAKQEMDPENTIYDAKRLIGRSANLESVANDIKNWPFKVVQESGNPLRYQVKVNKKDAFFSPEEISGIVLTKMKDIATTFVGSKVKDAVITVPAYFNSSQRAATVAAGKLAGLNILRLINEPTAAAIAFAMTKNGSTERKKVLVYDLGGGTFDVSILEMAGSEVKVLAVGGNNHLGGNDFDCRLFEHFKKVVKSKLKEDVTKQPRSKELLRNSCQTLKISLSGRPTATMGIHALIKGKDFLEKDFTRAKFEDLCSDLFEATIDCVKTTLKDAKLTPEAIDQVLLVGGSTRIPKIRQLLEKLFGSSKICQSVNPDEAVAEGAAYLAARLSGVAELKIISIEDVTSLTIGDRSAFGNFIPIITRNTQIPVTRRVKRLTLGDENVTRTRIYQGERVKCDENALVCDMNLQIDRSKKKSGLEELELKLDIDENGILHATIKQDSTGLSKSSEANMFVNCFAKDDVENIINDAQEHKEEDEAFRRRCTAANNLNHKMYAIRSDLESHTFRPKSSVSEKQALTIVSNGIEWLHAKRETASHKEIDELAAKIKKIVKNEMILMYKL